MKFTTATLGALAAAVALLSPTLAARGGSTNLDSSLARRRQHHARLVDPSSSSPRHVRRDATRIRRVKRGDGTVCRVRGSSDNATSTVYPAATSSTSSSSDAAATTVWSSSAAPAASSSSTSSSSPATAAPTAGTGSSATGFGLGWPNGDWASPSDANYIGNYIGDKASWYFTWSGWPVSSGDKCGLEFVPQLWGPDKGSDFESSQSQWGGNVKHVMFFNEPDIGGQANIGASDSVRYWQQYMSPLKAKGYKLGMAATTSGSSGLQWVKDFRTACPSCWDEVDFVPLHYYYVDATNFQQYVSNFYAEVQKPLWVTEYACQNFVSGGAQCSSGQTWSFHQTMADWFNAQSYVERFAPFGVMKEMQGVNQDNALMNPAGSITDLGNWYIYSS